MVDFALIGRLLLQLGSEFKAIWLNWVVKDSARVMNFVLKIAVTMTILLLLLELCISSISWTVPLHTRCWRSSSSIRLEISLPKLNPLRKWQRCLIKFYKSKRKHININLWLHFWLSIMVDLLVLLLVKMLYIGKKNNSWNRTCSRVWVCFIKICKPSS